MIIKHLQVNCHSFKLGFPVLPVAIPLRGNARNCAELSATVWNCAQLCGIALNFSRIAYNCAELRGIVRSLQGSQLRASKIHLRWKP